MATGESAKAAPPPTDMDRLQGAWLLFRVLLGVVIPNTAGQLAHLRDKLHK